MDVSKLRAVFLWEGLGWRARNGDHPTLKELLAAMREQGVPVEMGAYVADRIGAKSPSHRPKQTIAQKQDRCARALSYQYQVLRIHAELKRKREPSARSKAIKRVAKDNNLSPEYLPSLLKQGRRDARTVFKGMRWPKLQDALAVLDEHEVDSFDLITDAEETVTEG